MGAEQKLQQAGHQQAAQVTLLVGLAVGVDDGEQRQHHAQPQPHARLQQRAAAASVLLQGTAAAANSVDTALCCRLRRRVHA